MSLLLTYIIVSILFTVYGVAFFAIGRRTINKKRWPGEFVVTFSDESILIGNSGITTLFTWKTNAKILFVDLYKAAPGMLPSVEILCNSEAISYYPTTTDKRVTLVLHKPIGATSDTGKICVKISFERDPGLFEIMRIELEPAEKEATPSTQSTL